MTCSQPLPLACCTLLQAPELCQRHPRARGTGPFGPVAMGGMFSVMKVRRDQARGDYKDPGWYAHPPGTQSYEWSGSLPEPRRARPASSGGGVKPAASPSPAVEVTVRKPGSHADPTSR